MDENKFLKLSCAWLAVALTVYIVVFLMVVPTVTTLFAYLSMSRWL